MSPDPPPGAPYRHIWSGLAAPPGHYRALTTINHTAGHVGSYESRPVIAASLNGCSDTVRFRWRLSAGLPSPCPFLERIDELGCLRLGEVCRQVFSSFLRERAQVGLLRARHRFLGGPNPADPSQAAV